MTLIRWTIPGLLAAMVTLNLWRDGAAQDAPPPAQSYGSETAGCQACHSGGPDAKNMEGFNKRYNSKDYILLNEFHTWETHDPHKLASAAIDPKVNSIAATMQKNFDRTDPKFGAVNQNKHCLACHAVDNVPGVKFAEKKAGDYACINDEGINCFGCHGHGEWVSSHWTKAKDQFRNLPFDKNHKKEGLNNLRDPHVKAALCSSCHVGNAEEGKTVTHEMYAAGHPPLPPFELGAFMTGQPMHWAKPGDMPFSKDFTSEQKKAFSYRDAEGNEGYTARHLAMGALEALKAEAGLLVKESEKCAPDKPFDYARFDCYSCHHDLKLPSDRQNRGYDGPPGRPPLKAWNFALVGAIVEHAKAGMNSDLKALAEKYEELAMATKQAAYAKPFADATAMKTAAETLKKWCDDFANKLGEFDCFTPAESKRLLSVLEAQLLNSKNVNDPEPQLALLWAYRTLAGTLKEAKPWAEIAKVLPVEVRVLDDKETKPTFAGDVAKNRLKIFNSYRAEEFRKAFTGKP